MVNDFFFNTKLVDRINYYWKRRGVESRARLKKLFDSEGSVTYTIVSDLVVLPDYSIGVKDD
jgi:hypothetical protein